MSYHVNGIHPPLDSEVSNQNPSRQPATETVVSNVIYNDSSNAQQLQLSCAPVTIHAHEGPTVVIRDDTGDPLSLNVQTEKQVAEEELPSELKNESGFPRRSEGGATVVNLIMPKATAAAAGNTDKSVSEVVIEHKARTSSTILSKTQDMLLPFSSTSKSQESQKHKSHHQPQKVNQP